MKKQAIDLVKLWPAPVERDSLSLTLLAIYTKDSIYNHRNVHMSMFDATLFIVKRK